MESGIDTGWFRYDFTQCGGETSSDGKWRLIRGEGFATRISSNVRPQDPGGGAQTLAAPRRMMDIDVTDAPELSGGGGGGGGTSVGPSRNSVMVEEAIAGGTPRLVCPCDEQSG